MCTNYRAPDEDPGISELKIGIGNLFRRDPWERLVSDRPGRLATVLRRRHLATLRGRGRPVVDRNVHADRQC